ncbi:MAG: serine/threonine-protein kinase [Gemmatimonadales bacterium]|nr:serine/threonine-protein kinase [Gemmatimonadales bacterium]
MADLATELQRALGEAYTLERELGRGGMGAVWLAQDAQLHRAVAIKVLPPELATQHDLRERFLRETRMAASFSHPHIVPVHAVEERGGMLAFVMGYVDGESLGARVRRAGPVPVQEAVRLLQEVAWALSYAHGRGVIHRDVKPDNILIERATQRALVTDFGIARSTGAAPADGLTRVGEVVGTPHFMSPEQAAGDVLDGRSDLYSLGIVGFFALTGRLPFEAATPTSLLAMHLTQAPPSVGAFRPDAPAELVEAIDRCLAKAPEDRWANGEALAAALDGMRRSAPEVAPQVRVFLQRFGASVFGIFGLLFCALLVLDRGNSPNNDGDILLVAVVMAAAIWGLIVQAGGRVRVLLRQGFRYRDVFAASGALIAEEALARDAIRAMPDEMARRKGRIRIAILSLAWSPIGLWLVINYMRDPVPGRPGGGQISGPGAVIVVSAAIAFGLGVTMLASDPLKPNPFLKLQGLFWRGPLGRLVFRIGGYRLTGSSDLALGPSAGAAPIRVTGAGHATALAALPKSLRQGLGDAAPRMAKLAEELPALRQRENELVAAIAEAGDGAGGTEGVVAARREELRQELAAHLESTRQRQAQISDALELARLELVRLRTGLGSADAVRRALEL